MRAISPIQPGESARIQEIGLIVDNRTNQAIQLVVNQALRQISFDYNGHPQNTILGDAIAIVIINPPARPNSSPIFKYLQG